MTKDFGEYVRQIRLDKNLSLADVEDQSLRSISRGYVNQIENGQISPKSISLEKLKALADGLGVIVDELVSRAFERKEREFQSRDEILVETFGGRDLSADDWREIEAVVKTMIELKRSRRTDDLDVPITADTIFGKG